MTTKRQQGATQQVNLAQATQEDAETYTEELGDRQANPPRTNMIRLVNHMDSNRGSFHEGKHLNFPIASLPSRPYNHHLMERVDTVTDANDCPNLLSHEATFRMSVLLPNHPKSMVVEGENVPHFKKMSGDKMRAPTGPSNIFQILGDIWK